MVLPSSSKISMDKASCKFIPNVFWFGRTINEISSNTEELNITESSCVVILKQWVGFAGSNENDGLSIICKYSSRNKSEICIISRVDKREKECLTSVYQSTPV